LENPQALNVGIANPDRRKSRQAEFVTHPEDWLYSSAIDYAGGKGLLNVDALLI